MMSKRLRKPKTPRSLAVTLIIAFLGLSVAALLIAYIPQLSFSLQAEQGSVYREQQLVAQKAANAVAAFVQGKFDTLESAIKLGDLADSSPAEQKRMLQSLLGFDRAFRQLILLDTHQQELSRASRISQSAVEQLGRRVESDLFTQVRQAGRYVSSVYIDELTNEPMVIVAVPATDILGEFQGTLLAEVNLKFMWDLVNRLAIGGTGQVYVVDGQGDLIAANDISRVLSGENVSQLPLIGEFMRDPVPAGEAVTGRFPGLDRITVIGTYVPLDVPNWAVVTELPLKEAIRPFVQSWVISGAVMVFVATLIGLASVYIARRLARPLLDLTETATQIAAGELRLKASVEGPAEISRLAVAFNSMTAQLRELIGGLERRVADRTRELEQRARQLATAADVGRAAASVLEMDALTQQVVELVRERFDLYYAALFLLDATGKYAVLEAGTGEAGHVMMDAGHRLEVGGISMVGSACARRQARIALDVGEERVRFDNPLLPETRSEMALPLMVGERVLGALDVQSVEPAAFSEQDVAVLQLAADQVAVAVDNAHKFSDEAALLEATNPLFRIVRHLAVAATVDQVAEVILDSVAETEADGCAVATLQFSPSGAAETITFLGSWDRKGDSPFPLGVPMSLDTLHLPLSMVTSFWVAEDILEEDRIPEGARHFLARSGNRAYVNVPLQAGSQLIGHLSVFRTTPGPFSPVSIRLYETLADQAALALERARLLEDAQHQASRQQLIGEVTARMRETLDLETVLQTAIREMGAVLGIPRIEVRLGREMPRAGNGRGPEEKGNTHAGLD